MIAFGFKQINIKQGILHPNTATEAEIHDKYMSTSWNELEVDMGLMNKRPILLVKDKDTDSGDF